MSLPLLWTILFVVVVIIAAQMGAMSFILTLRRVQRMRRAAMDRVAERTLVALAQGKPMPPVPRRRGERAAALEAMIDATVRLKGRMARRARKWFEENGFVDDSIADLRSHTGWKRARGAYRLGCFGTRRVRRYLVPLLRDERYEVRDAALRALGRCGGPEVVHPILRAFERNDVPRGLVSGALVGLDEDADGALVDALDRPNATSRALVAQVIGLRGRGPHPELIPLLRDETPEVRREAALCLGRTGGGGDGTEWELRRLTRDGVPWVRAAAATALGSAVGTGAAPALLSLAADEDFWVGHRAAEALVGLPDGEERAWSFLLGGGGDGAERARPRLLEWMEERGGVERRLRSALDDGGEDIPRLLDALEQAGSTAWAREAGQ